MSKLVKSFGYAFKGLAYAFKTQLNFKIHTAALVLVVLLGICLRLSTTEWLWIVLAASLVLSAELLNTALELLVDLVSPEFNPKAGIVKDLAAAAVLICAIFALIIGLMIFIPKFF